MSDFEIYTPENDELDDVCAQGDRTPKVPRVTNNTAFNLLEFYHDEDKQWGKPGWIIRIRVVQSDSEAIVVGREYLIKYQSKMPGFGQKYQNIQLASFFRAVAGLSKATPAQLEGYRASETRADLQRESLKGTVDSEKIYTLQRTAEGATYNKGPQAGQPKLDDEGVQLINTKDVYGDLA